MKPIKPCELCGKPTRGNDRVCSRRSCIEEYHRRKYVTLKARRDMPILLAPPCDVCGNPTFNLRGVCLGSDACVREYHLRSRRSLHGYKLTKPCRICKKPTWAKYGVCRRRNDAHRLCRNEYAKIRKRNRVVTWLKLPIKKHVGRRHPAWTGGKNFTCYVCGIDVGWRCLSRQKRNGGLFRCGRHRMKRILKGSSYERKTIRSLDECPAGSTTTASEAVKRHEGNASSVETRCLPNREAVA